MPIVELLGAQLDMQQLLKLSVSVAAVLLISWAYKFYGSRGARNKQPCGKDKKEIQNTGCQNYRRTLQCESLEDESKDDEDRQGSTTEDPASECRKEVRTELRHQAEMSKEAADKSNCDQDEREEEENLPHEIKLTGSTSHLLFGSASSLCEPMENKMASPKGRRSPCLLTKLEGSVGVGRELRQDLEHQGVYSSFLSKAEIKVGDAKVVLEGSGEQIVHGKIYDYYVESLSHSFANSKTLLSLNERHTDSEQDFGSHDSSLTRPPSSLSSIMIRDLVFPESEVEDTSPQESLGLRHPARPARLRKMSYLSAAENSELPAPFQFSTASTSTAQTLASTSDETIPLLSSTDGKHKMEEETDLETNARAPFLLLPNENFLNADLEIIKSKLDLGNCLEVLHLAKKKGQKSIEQAALGVMSDNYLQVLRDPNLYGRLMANEREQIRKQRMRGRPFVIAADMDPQDWLKKTEGQRVNAEQRSQSSAMYYYDDYKDCWHTLCLIPQEVISNACAMCTMDNYLFVAVGCQGRDTEMTPSKRVLCYNPLTSIWKEISPMNKARPRCKLAALEGYIYAIGGECLSSVERYDPRQDRWTFVAPLPNDTFAVAHQVAVCSGELFVSGGTLRYMLLRYNPKADTWRPSLMLSSNDRTADMAAVGRFLYRFDVNTLLGVSVYRYHTVARLWYECSCKRLLRCPAFQCVAMGSTVYCISRHFTMKFRADEISPAFADEDLSILSAAKGILFPFVLSLPDKSPRQTSV
nr:kelch domain-containing protein 7A [Nothobranchius furzeri]